MVSQQWEKVMSADLGAHPSDRAGGPADLSQQAVSAKGAHPLRWVRNLLAWRRQAKALKRYGWDFKCYQCERWVHAEQCAKAIAETDWHWHYRCDCGAMNHIWLGGMYAAPDDGRWGGDDAWAAIATAAGTDETRSGSAEGKGAGRKASPKPNHIGETNDR